MDLPPYLEGTTLANHWSSSVGTLPARIPFLSPAKVEESARWAGFEGDAIPFLLRAAERIFANPDARLLAWHCHRLLFTPELRPPDGIAAWPMPIEFLDEFCGALYLLAALSGIPLIRSRHEALGVPEQVMRDTYRDALVWARQNHEIGIFRDGRFSHPVRAGTWGIDPRILPWLLSHLDGDLYRVGRLQYKTGPFRQSMRAYRNRKDGRTVLLADSGLVFRADGRFDGAGGITDPDGRWTSELANSPDSVRGNPIHPAGSARKEQVSLPLDEWDLVLQKDDPILEIHIPEDGRMDFGACGKSVSAAVDFFTRCHPERTFKAVVCASWFLDPTYQCLLPDTSNIVRFQRECYLFPLNSQGARSGVERIFGAHAHDLDTAPRNTALRRNVLDHFAQGGVLTAGGALLFSEDLAKWGSQTYLSRF